MIMSRMSGTRNQHDNRVGDGPFAETKSNLQDAASSAAEEAREAAASVADKARGVASNVGQRISEAASTAGAKADDAASSLGGGMQSLAGAIRDKMPQEGMVGSAGSAVADTLERGGRYLKKQGLSGIGQDLTDAVRRHPIPALLIALGAGFLIARSTRS
jgi:hypothetical protein